jgi:hypothetical protein
MHILNRKRLLLVENLVILLLAAVVGISADGKSDLAHVRAAGCDLLEGLDHCFENPLIGATGFH